MNSWNARMVLGGCCALAAVGCDTAADSSADTNDETGSASSGPMLAEVTVNASTIGEGDFAELTIVATHGHALDDLVGGLVRVDMVLLGPLVQVSNGVFTFAAPFDDLSNAAGIAGGLITLEIELLDNAGKSTSTTVDINVCSIGSSVCEPGQCTNTRSSDAHCGSCSNPCDPGEECIDAYCSGQGGSDSGYSDSGYYAEVDYDAFAAEPQDAPVSELPIPSRTSEGLDLSAFNL